MLERPERPVHLFLYSARCYFQLRGNLPVAHIVLLMHPENELLLPGQLIDGLLDQLVLFFTDDLLICRRRQILPCYMQQQRLLPFPFPHFIQEQVAGILPQQGQDGMIVLHAGQVLPEADITFLHDIFTQMHFPAHGKQHGKELAVCIVNDPL